MRFVKSSHSPHTTPTAIHLSSDTELVIAMPSIGSIIALAGIGIAGLSLAGAPAYLFEDVMKLESHIAWGLGGVVWVFVSLFLYGSGLDIMASLLLFDLLGFVIPSPLTLAGVGLGILYFFTAFSEMSADEAEEFN